MCVRAIDLLHTKYTDTCVLGLLILLLYLRFLSRFWIRSDSVVFCLCFSFFFKLLPLLAPRGFSFSVRIEITLTTLVSYLLLVCNIDSSGVKWHISSIMRVLRPTHLMRYCRQIFLLFASLSLAVFIPLLCGCWWSVTKVCFCGIIWVAIY